MRIVVKVGTSTLTHPTGCLNIRRIEMLCKVLADLKNAGHEVILVSSGAVGMGVGKLNLGARPRDTVGKQAAAAVGQCELMYTYDKLFSEYNRTVAQILLTAEDFRDEKRHRNFSNTMERLISLGVIPVINENDTVATDEIEIGDNDTLAAMVAARARGCSCLCRTLKGFSPPTRTAIPMQSSSPRCTASTTALWLSAAAAAHRERAAWRQSSSRRASQRLRGAIW